MKKIKIRRTDDDVLLCGELVSQGYNVVEIEALVSIPHSTAHWIIMNRLPALDKELFENCLIVFKLHKKHRRRKVNDRTENAEG